MSRLECDEQHPFKGLWCNLPRGHGGYHAHEEWVPSCSDCGGDLKGCTCERL